MKFSQKSGGKLDTIYMISMKDQNKLNFTLATKGEFLALIKSPLKANITDAFVYAMLDGTTMDIEDYVFRKDIIKNFG
jgi:hypothetical protein